jgi:hypothetical protein
VAFKEDIEVEEVVVEEEVVGNDNASVYDVHRECICILYTALDCYAVTIDLLTLSWLR